MQIHAILVMLLFLFISFGGSNSENQVTTGQIAKCEFDALKLGTEIADVFNAPIGKQDWNQRVHQDLIAEKLGFAPWITNGLHGSNGLTLTGKNAKEIQMKNGWAGKSINESPYAILQHKWVYMLGDSTTRQIWASYAAPFLGNNFERNAKEWTRQYCNKQANRFNHPKGGTFEQEGWRGPCGVNEVTCYVSGYGDEGLLTFDWKHFPYEDYDDYIWGPLGLFKENSTERIPDILTVQVGLHSCWHAHPAGFYSDHLTEVNQTLLQNHHIQIPKLMKSIKEAIMRSNSETMVVIMTAGSTYVKNSANMDECIVEMNRITSDAAHEYGFPVLERGEIERRAMYKSYRSMKPLITPDTHLQQPIQNIVATCLLELLNCLNLSRSLQKLSAEIEVLGMELSSSGYNGFAQPLHVPP